MRASILQKTNEPLILEAEIVVPSLRAGQVLVKVAYSGVCRSQLMEARGGRGQDKYLPHLLGHEGTGVVTQVGSAVTRVNIGQRVVLTWLKGTGCDELGTVFSSPRLGTINCGSVATFGEYAVVSENRVYPLPPEIPMDIGVLFGCAIPTGAGIVLNMIKPKKGETVAIFGLGGVGLSALMTLRLFDCGQVIAVDVSDDKLNLASELGATSTINSKVLNPLTEISRLTDGRGVDYAVDASGATQVIEQAFRSVRKFGGHCVFASHPPSGENLSIDPYDLICGRRISGSWGGEIVPDRDFPRLMELYTKHKLPLEKLIQRGYSLETVNRALDDLESNRSLRPLLAIDSALGSLS